MRFNNDNFNLFIELSVLLKELEHCGREGLTLDHLNRITALSKEMNKLNPKFEVIEFVEDTK